MGGLDAGLIQSLVQVFGNSPNIERVILFGSRAKGNYRRGSDIDLAIISNGASLDLGTLASDIDALNTPYLFDLLDYQQLNNPALLEHIHTYGQILFQRVE